MNNRKFLQLSILTAIGLPFISNANYNRNQIIDGEFIIENILPKLKIIGNNHNPYIFFSSKEPRKFIRLNTGYAAPTGGLLSLNNVDLLKKDIRWVESNCDSIKWVYVAIPSCNYSHIIFVTLNGNLFNPPVKNVTSIMWYDFI